MIFVGIAAIASGGLDRSLTERAEVAIKQLDRAQDEFPGLQSRIESALAQAPELFRPAGYDKSWPPQIKAAASQLAAAQAQTQQITDLIAENDSEKGSLLEELTQKIDSDRLEIEAVMNEILAATKLRLEFKQNRPGLVLELEQAYLAVTASEFTGTEARIKQAVLDWPGKKQDLQTRLDSAKSLVTDADTAWKIVQTQDKAFTAEDKSFNIERFMAAAGSLRQVSRLAKPNLKKIGSLIDQLYVSWDKLLVDMDVREGQVVTFHHKIKTVTVQHKVLSMEESEEKNPATESEAWTAVSKSRFESMKKNLGMVISHKSAGKYENEAENRVQPAGYAYMASKEQKRNRYGYWNHGSGGSFWIWYGQYSMMRSMFWGPGYYRSHPVYMHDYTSYRRSTRAGQTYYGRNSSGKPRYGSTGSGTKSRYASSKYNKTKGFKNTKYVKSGGKYRGSRYASRSSGSRSSTYRSGSSSRSRSSSRSFSRSSSRSRGGK